MGAIASGGVRIVSEDVVRAFGIPDRVLASVAAVEEEELHRRERAYREDRPIPDMRGKTVILVDDGLATGATMRAAVATLRAMGASRVVAAAPVAPPETCLALREVVDQMICVLTPDPFLAVGAWYEDFSETSDETVRALLRRAAETGT
jgi:predicted phosphoribosyltransferase